MGFFIGWRKRLPGGFSIGWRKWLGGSRRRRAGTGCGAFLLLACCGMACLTALPKAASTPTAQPIASTATLAQPTQTQRSVIAATSAVVTIQASSTSAPASPTLNRVRQTETAIAAKPAASLTVAVSATSRPAAQPTATRRPAQGTATQAPVVEATATQQPAPTQAPAAAITLVSLTTPAARNSNATLVIQADAGVTCILSYTTPSGSASSADGLGSVTADGAGRCTWTWKIGPSTKQGTGSLFVTVGNQHASFEIVIQ